MSTAQAPDQNSFCLISTIPKLLAGNLNLEPGEEFNGALFRQIFFRQ
jgi:hypothetical protein